MNWNIVEDKWKRFKGTMKIQRGKLAGEQPDMIVGKRVESACKMQEASPKVECKMKEEILPRRDVLRGALAVGCTLLLPTVFSGCDSKKGESPTSSAPAPAAPPATSTDSAAPAGAKMSQASVQYQTNPKGDQQCSGCANFIPESNACKRVEGQISPDGWCTLWTKKA